MRLKAQSAQKLWPDVADVTEMSPHITAGSHRTRWQLGVFFFRPLCHQLHGLLEAMDLIEIGDFPMTPGPLGP